MDNSILAHQIIGLVKSEAPDSIIEEILDDFELKVRTDQEESNETKEMA